MRKAINLYQLVHQAGKRREGRERGSIHTLLPTPLLSSTQFRLGKNKSGRRERETREGGRGKRSQNQPDGYNGNGQTGGGGGVVATAAGAATTAGGRPWQPWKEPEKRAGRREGVGWSGGSSELAEEQEGGGMK